MTTPAAPKRALVARRAREEWRERSARLFEEFSRPARAMVRRAFRGAFCEDELDDIYAGAWASTLRALERRADALDDAEIRSYVFTAVANQASRELRRRGRKPTAPLELPESAPDTATTPEETAVSAESSRIARDLLTSLPPRRRAVMLLRYGWGLEPKQVCGLVQGLSPRAYRKEVTRGVDELVERMRTVERGEWCGEREPVLKAFAAGVADSDQRLQAQAHLSHCRGCSDFVARLNGHLHDLGSGVAGPMAIDGLDGHLSIADRLGEVGERLRDATGGVISRGSSAADEAAATITSSGGARGAGAAGAGAFAKLAGLGTAGKVALACLGGGAAATACVAAGVVPLSLGTAGADRAPAHERQVEEKGIERLSVATEVVASAPTEPEQSADQAVDEAGASPQPVESAEPAAPPPAPAPEPAPVPASAPPVQQEFGVAAAAAPASPAGSSSGTSSSGGGGSGGGSAVQQEFGP